MSHLDAIETRRIGTVDGFDLLVKVVPDYDTDARTHLDEDEHADVIATWLQDRWTYVGLVVIAERNGIELGSASLFGMEDGYLSDEIGYQDALHSDWGQECLADLIADAVEDANQTVWDDSIPHRGHTLFMTGAWFCDTCNSPYCIRA